MEKYTTEIKDVKEIENLHDFYTYSLSTENGKKNLKITIQKSQFVDLLNRLNFFTYCINREKVRNIYINDNRAIPVDDNILFSELIKYIKSLPTREVKILDKSTKDTETGEYESIPFNITPKKIIDAVINNSSNLSVKSNFFFLNLIDDTEFQHDTADKKFFYFNNVIAEIEKGAALKFYDYKALTSKVWENNIINRDFAYTERKGDFEQFFEKITGQDNERKKSLMSMLGYLLHNYFFYDLSAIYLTDVNLNNDERAGGTGKGILYKALREVLNRNIHNDSVFTRLDGNKYSKENKYYFQQINIDTQVVAIDELKKNYDVSTFMTEVTEGFTVEKKHLPSFHHFAKILFTTNFAPNFKDDSDKRRALIFELSNYYSAKLRPSDEFNKWFFGIDWDSADWNEFYSFMIRCANEFLQNGITQVEEINYNQRVILQVTCEEFVEWIEDKFSPYIYDRTETKFYKDDLYSDYVSKNSETLNKYKEPKRKFYEWVRTYCQKMSYSFDEFRSTTDEFYLFPTKETKQKCFMKKSKNKTLF